MYTFFFYCFLFTISIFPKSQYVGELFPSLTLAKGSAPTLPVALICQREEKR